MFMSWPEYRGSKTPPMLVGFDRGQANTPLPTILYCCKASVMPILILDNMRALSLSIVRAGHMSYLDLATGNIPAGTGSGDIVEVVMDAEPGKFQGF